MESAIGSSVNVFAYGSNMCAQRIRARVASATTLTTGYVTHRRLVFHKRGKDGSAKADAVYTGCVNDCVWGVVFALSHKAKPVLDQYEFGYDEEEVLVVSHRGVLPAITYVARAEAIDPSLKPYSWYHRYVTHGAQQHELPMDYVEHLQTFESIADPDRERAHRNSQLITASRPEQI